MFGVLRHFGRLPGDLAPSAGKALFGLSADLEQARASLEPALAPLEEVVVTPDILARLEAALETAEPSIRRAGRAGLGQLVELLPRVTAAPAPDDDWEANVESAVYLKSMLSPLEAPDGAQADRGR